MSLSRCESIQDKTAKNRSTFWLTSSAPSKKRCEEFKKVSLLQYFIHRILGQRKADQVCKKPIGSQIGPIAPMHVDNIKIVEGRGHGEMNIRMAHHIGAAGSDNAVRWKQIHVSLLQRDSFFMCYDTGCSFLYVVHAVMLEQFKWLRRRTVPVIEARIIPVGCVPTVRSSQAVRENPVEWNKLSKKLIFYR